MDDDGPDIAGGSDIVFANDVEEFKSSCCEKCRSISNCMSAVVYDKRCYLKAACHKDAKNPLGCGLPSNPSSIRAVPIRTSHDREQMIKRKPANCTYQMGRDDLGVNVGRIDLEQGDEEARRADCCRHCRDNKHCRVGVVAGSWCYLKGECREEIVQRPGCADWRDHAVSAFVVRG
eukprot:gnl/TRDRNA2_/TRDRNA2_167805_c1_seq8.p1 gnl/TRDRNA2_/TRDRNA2_167805_c1~~gnl/TRDRNA2_/TRDRNA2_167805_c1_seq8.p1  ORF type:complete len:190 (+),score=20.43 gnl/TRDRNA2_/TRDRNA2_167805_c1_seq8:45-572(+)